MVMNESGDPESYSGDDGLLHCCLLEFLLFVVFSQRDFHLSPVDRITL